MRSMKIIGATGTNRHRRVFQVTVSANRILEKEVLRDYVFPHRSMHCPVMKSKMNFIMWKLFIMQLV